MVSAADRLAQRHQRDIAAIAGGVTSVVAATALGADPMAVSTWYWSVVDSMIARIQVGYAQARQSGTSFLRRHAALSGHAGVDVVPGSLDVTRVRERLRISGPVAFKTSIAAGYDTDHATRSMAVGMSGVADECVRNGDRDVVQQTALRGSGVAGWRRMLVGRSCGFCSMLASRGAVYVSRDTAMVAADGMKYHPHCNCAAVPLYRHEQEPADVRRLQRQWDRITAGHHGKDKARAWARHWNRVEPRPRRSSAFDPVVQIRQSLASAQSPEQVAAAFRAEFRAITGRDVDASFSGSVATAREHAEGLLRTVERYPQTPLTRVEVGPLPFSRYAESRGGVVTFSDHWSSVEGRPRYMAALKADQRRGWHPYSTPDGVAAHEVTHVLDPDVPVESIVVRRPLPGYAARSEHEAVAEALADVVVNGPGASVLSREIAAAVDDAYRAGRYAGRRPRLARPGPPSRLSPPARGGPQARAAEAEFRSAGARPLREILDDGSADVVYMGRLEGEVRRAMGGEYPGGLLVEVQSVSFGTFRGERYMGIDGVIRNAQGRKVGTFSREIREVDGELIAEHHLLQLDRKMDQGSGFAEAFNANLEDWYVRSGVKEIRLTANIDVGGYAWARKGYEFVDDAAAREFLDAADTKIAKALDEFDRTGKLPKGITEAGLRELRIFVDDMRAGRITASAPEIARFGRLEGQGGKAAVWPGKWLMLGEDTAWKGVLPVRRALAAEANLSSLRVADLRAMAAARGVTVPASMRKDALVRLVSDLESGVPGPVALGRATASTAPTRVGLEGTAAHRAALRERPLTAAQRDALEGYGRGNATGINVMLRQSRGGITDSQGSYLADLARQMDEVMAGQSLPETIVVRRSQDAAQIRAVLGRAPRVGDTYVDPAFLSTTTRADGYGAGNVELVITVPQGTRALSMPDSPRVLDRGEVVLDRGLTYRIARIERLGGGRTRMHVEVVAARGAAAPVKAAKKAAAKATPRKAAPTARTAVGSEVDAAVPLKRSTLAPTLQTRGVSSAAAEEAGHALTAYQLGPFNPINRRLYDTGELGTRQKVVDAIDAAFQHAAISRDIKVYVGTKNFDRLFPEGEWSHVGGMEGKEFVVPGYWSSSSAERIADDFAPIASEHPIVVTVVAPKGTRAIRIDGGGESEVLLDRGLRYRVVVDHGVVDGKRRIEVEVVGSVDRQLANLPTTEIAARLRAKGLSTSGPRSAMLQRLDAAGAPAKAAKRAAPAKKVAAPKPPPSPEKMTPTALRKEIGDAGEGLPLADLPKAELQASVARLRGGASVAQERAALAEAVTQQKRIVADALDEITRALDADRGVSRLPLTLQRIIDAAGDGAAAKALRPVLTAMRTGNPAALRRAMAAAERKAGLRRTGEVGRVVDGRVVRRQGVEVEVGGRTVVLREQEITAATGRDVGLPSRDVPTLRAVFDEPDVDAARRALREGIEGTYAGLRVEVVEATRGPKHIYLQGTVHDASGRQVGSFTRWVEIEDGGLVASHSFLSLAPKMQGSGFAEAFNANLMDWYRRSGVREVRLVANIDVGGYAWATKGFDFRDRDAAEAFIDAATEKVRAALKRFDRTGKLPKGITEEDLRALALYVDDMASGRVPASAPEIARFRRRPGQSGKTATWAGKWLMLGSEWRGRLPL